MSKCIAYIGTYSKGENGGIFRVEIDDQTGDLAVLDTLDVENPSHLALSPDGKFLYAASETGKFRDQLGGAVAACAVDAQGKLSLLNMEGTEGVAPCYVAVAPDGKFVYAANYGQGTATVFAVDDQGRVCDHPKIIEHQGKGANPQRQERPHVHITRVTPDGKYLAVCDLGIDAVVLYPLCATCGVDKNRGSFVRTPDGDGPRHIEFSKDGKYAYVVTEMGCTVRAYAYEDGRMTFLSAISTLPEDFDGQNIDAAIHFAPDGKTLVASNRGHDSLTLLDVDGGQMRVRQIVKVGGKTPREFAYTANGKFVFVCNQDSADITVLAADEAGNLTLTAKKYDLPKPVCLIWKN